MKKNLTLLVLAAGMGSRFGGLKQIEPVGPNNEFIIDYSVKDAIDAGFNKIFFIIKEENYESFKNTIGKRLSNKIPVEYVFQKNSDLPDGINIPKERVKPLGTAYALYCARNIIKENFATINADDFYGKDSYVKAAEFLNNCAEDEYAIIGYEINKTMTENGAVKRGIIYEQEGQLEKIVESSVYRKDNKIIAKPLLQDEEFEISENSLTSMNLICFTPKIFTYLDEHIKEFFLNNKNLAECEWLIPDVLVESAKENHKKIKVIKTDSEYYGMTYREDLKDLKLGILKEIEKGNYKNNLWG